MKKLTKLVLHVVNRVTKKEATDFSLSEFAFYCYDKHCEQGNMEGKGYFILCGHATGHHEGI